MKVATLLVCAILVTFGIGTAKADVFYIMTGTVVGAAAGSGFTNGEAGTGLLDLSDNIAETGEIAGNIINLEIQIGNVLFTTDDLYYWSGQISGNQAFRLVNTDGYQYIGGAGGTEDGVYFHGAELDSPTGTAYFNTLPSNWTLLSRDETSSVAEPNTFAVLSLGVGTIAFVRRRYYRDLQQTAQAGCNPADIH